MILVDAHAHIHECYNMEGFFDSAYANFKTAAFKAGCENDFTGILLLTESLNHNWFRRLAIYADGNNSYQGNRFNSWKLKHTSEECFLFAQKNDIKRLFLIAGRQLVTAEKLEILALATDAGFTDGKPIKELIEEVRKSGGIPVIPWGFGKWQGFRGRIVKELIEDADHPNLFLGDNAGRPGFFPRPRLFRLAEKKGINILPGSDTLPFAQEFCQAGKFGFAVREVISKAQPARDLRRILMDPELSLRHYGELETPLRFFRNQIAMQLRKRIEINTRA